MIVSSEDADPRPNDKNPDARDYFNSTFLISPTGQLAERYNKRNLVIFGESLPFRHWLPFLKYFTPSDADLTPGTRDFPFALTDLHVVTSILICFEDIFPQLGRGDVQPDTDFLVNVTNDGWFGESAAQWQQALAALFRAVENGVPLIRCANNGLTCWIDADGRLRDCFHDRRGTVYGPGFMTVRIPLGPAGQTHPQTFYNRHGDWFGWTCVAVAGCLLLRRFRQSAGSAKV
jgi:apolipoprotein N-acyltransferase